MAINANKKQIEYWRDRMEQLYLAGEKNALDVAKSLQKNYKKAFQEMEKNINAFFGKYANENGLTYAQAKKLLNRNELKSFKEYLDEIIELSKKENITAAQIKKLELLKTKAKISRLQELETQIEYEMNKLTAKNTIEIGQFLEDTYEDVYYNTLFNKDQYLGFSSSFSTLNTEAVKQAVNTKYLEATFTTRLYKNSSNLMAILNNEIPRGLILGYNPKKIAKLASKKLDTDYNNTVRLIRTEYNRILNEAVVDGYKEAKIDRYQILATLDSRTSEICQAMDLEIIPLAEKEVGVNFPPFHPNCRTTTIPYFEPDEFTAQEMRIARDEEGETYYVPANVNYRQWKAGLVQQADGVYRYENKKGGK